MVVYLRTTGALAVLVTALLWPALTGGATPANPIAAENALPGTSDWQRPGGGPEIYGSEIGAAPGDVLHLHVSTAARYRIVVYRLGWYGGAGGRLYACSPGCTTDEQGTVQPAPTSSQPLRADWPVTDTIQTGSEWVSGYYLVEAVATTGESAGHAGATFVVLRQPADQAPSAILDQVPVNTWEAYNDWGGESLYDYHHVPHGHAVSFDRPFDVNAQSPMWWEIQGVRFLEREGYDVSYQTDLDTERDAGSLLRHQLVIVGGHDEYWTIGMRIAFTAALAQGTNLAFLNSNDAYWNMRYADDGRTLVTWKGNWDPEPVASLKTTLMREIGRPECELMGVVNVSVASIPHTLDYTVTAAGAADRWLRNTGLQAGDTIAGIVGREHDQLNPWPDSCVHPGLVDLFHYEATGDQNSDAVRFTAPSGARVFASGAQQFTWALDGWRSDGNPATHTPTMPWQGVPADARVQAFMRNALDDLTRPAPPVLTAAYADPRHRLVHVSVQLPDDPRVHGFSAVLVGNDGKPQFLCTGTTTCTGVRPSQPGRLRVWAVSVDDWHRFSTAAARVVSAR